MTASDTHNIAVFCEAIVNEASGELALQNEIHLTGVNRNRKPEEYQGGYFETAFILKKLKEYGIADASVIDLPVEESSVWDAESAELWIVEPGLRKIADLKEVPACLASGSSSTDTTAELVYVGPGNREEHYKDKDVEGKVLLVDGYLDGARRLASRSTAPQASSAGPRAIPNSTGTRSAGAASGAGRRTSPLRADRAQGAVRRRRLPLRRQGVRHAGQGARDPRATAHRPALRRAAVLECAPDGGRRAGGVHRALRGARHPLRAGRVQSSAVHPVLLGHHRRAQVHRARHGRHAPAAPQGAPAAQRRARGGSPVLLHDARLDDVELAGVGPGERRRAAALRRLAVRRARQDPLRHGGRRGHDALRHFRQVLRRDRQDRPEAQGDAPARALARNPLDRLAVGGRWLRLRVPQRQGRRVPVLHLGRHRHRQLLRARQPDAAGVARRDPVQGPRLGENHPMQSAVSQDGNKIYTVTHHEPIITEITKNGETWTITREFTSEAFHHLYGADLSPDGKYLYVTCSNNDPAHQFEPHYKIPDKTRPSLVCMYDVTTNELVKILDVGSFATGIAAEN